MVIATINLISRGNIHCKFHAALTDQYKLCQHTEETNMDNSEGIEKPHTEYNF